MTGPTGIRPPVEVRVYRHGVLKLYEWCGSDEEAVVIAEMWSGCSDARCEIHGAGD
jgi:hypothetical protein